MLEEAARHGKAVWILDRPNPVGRPIEGLALRPGWESFVGAGPMPMRHGLTMGELAHWFVATLLLKVDYRVIELQGWKPDAGPGTDRDTAREKTAQNDRAAKNQSGLGSNPSARDVTSGRHSGNQ